MEEYYLYQRIKNRTEIPVEKLMINEVPKKAWMYLMVDFITKLPLVAGKDTILVVCNKLSKMVYFITTMNKILVESLARLFRNNM